MLNSHHHKKYKLYKLVLEGYNTFQIYLIYETRLFYRYLNLILHLLSYIYIGEVASVVCDAGYKSKQLML